MCLIPEIVVYLRAGPSGRNVEGRDGVTAWRLRFRYLISREKVGGIQ